MAFADKYLKKQRMYPEYVSAPVDENLNIIVTIPCYDEPDLIPSLEALWNCERTNGVVEVIVIVNSGEQTEQQ